jgi:DNA mismatch endonuclease, patch repair protein
MSDTVSPEKRSRMMARIRSKNTTPELVVRSFLFRSGLRYRLHAANLPGKPDIVLPKYRAAVLVQGCFWHQHPGCKFAYQPKSRREFWLHKLASNVARDKRVVAQLRESGWRVFIVWECQLMTPSLEQLVFLIRDQNFGSSSFAT